LSHKNAKDVNVNYEHIEKRTLITENENKLSCVVSAVVCLPSLLNIDRTLNK